MCHGYNTVKAKRKDRHDTTKAATGIHLSQRGGGLLSSIYFCEKVFFKDRVVLQSLR